MCSLHRVPELHSVLRQNIKLKPIHHFLGSEKAVALPEFYSITGADVTGHFNGKGRPTRFNIFKKIGDDVIGALAGLDLGGVSISNFTHWLWEFLLSTLQYTFCNSDETQVAYVQTAERKPRHREATSYSRSTPWAYTTCTFPFHVHVWLQDLVAEPDLIDPAYLGWRREDDGTYMYAHVVSKVPLAPEAVIKLVNCNCVISTCSGLCSSKAHNLTCTELCKCEGD